MFTWRLEEVEEVEEVEEEVVDTIVFFHISSTLNI